jgi:hypothetical protein
VPPFLNTKSNLAVFEDILDELDKTVGDKTVYLMYDLREWVFIPPLRASSWTDNANHFLISSPSDYQKSAELKKQVNKYKHRKSLLLWYTADE